jgi:hypothetical protein
VSRQADIEVQALERPAAQVHIIEGLVAGYFEEANGENRMRTPTQAEAQQPGKRKSRLGYL